MKSLLENGTAPANSAPNSEPEAPLPAESARRIKDFRAETSTPDATYNANVPCDLIEPDPKNRDRIDPEALGGLAASIKADGLLQPIVLRIQASGKYRIIAGERRWRAHLQLKLPTIAARIYRSETDLAAARKKIAENHQRENLTPIEEAKRIKELSDLGMKQGDIGQLLGKSQPVVANTLRLLELPAKVQELIADGKLTSAHGVSLARFSKWPAACEAMAHIAVNEETSSKELNRDTVPFRYRLEHSGKLVMIDTRKDVYWSPTYTIPPELQKDPDFLQVSSNSWVCFAPAKWSRIQKVQKAAWEKKQAKERGSRGAGPMSDKDKAERAKKIAQNKAARSAIDETLKNAIGRLQEVRGLDEAATIVVAERAWGQDFEEAAAALGVKLPARGFLSLEQLRPLGLPLLVKLCAVEIMLEESNQARRFASAVPDSVEFIAGKFKAAGAVAKDGEVVVSVNSSSSDNRARAGSATASCTGSPAAAAKAAAAKHFACKPEGIELQSKGHGEYIPRRSAATVDKAAAAKRASISDQTRGQVKKLVESGRTGAEIAKQLKISLPSVQNIKKALGLVRAK